MVRKPCVSGSFYPDDRRELAETVCGLLVACGEKETARGVIVPHAGYVYSGAVAGAVYGRVVVPPLVVMLGPNHTGRGPEFSLMVEGRWQTPLGEVPVSPLARDLLAASALLAADTSAHQAEHSLEVQLPFLQVCAPPGPAIIPIITASRDPEALAALGRELAEFIGRCGIEALLLASSDLSHYEPDRIARAKDALALEPVGRLAPDELLRRVEAENISMCGAGPAAAVLYAARRLGATGARVVRYATSAEASGDFRRVVGYAGVIIS
jgi:AmmeMemoRadiSam system protein B